MESPPAIWNWRIFSSFYWDEITFLFHLYYHFRLICSTLLRYNKQKCPEFIVREWADQRSPFIRKYTHSFSDSTHSTSFRYSFYLWTHRKSRRKACTFYTSPGNELRMFLLQQCYRNVESERENHTAWLWLSDQNPTKYYLLGIPSVL